MIKYAVESLDQWYWDIQPLLPKHHKEIAVHLDIPLDPDWVFYRKAQELGMLVTYTARIDGGLVGYAIFFYRERHHHYKSVGWAIDDVIWIMHEHRRHGVASGLFDLAETDLQKRGAAIIQIQTKEAHPELAALLKSRGYAHTDNVFSKRV